jgi:hypothetical protein
MSLRGVHHCCETSIGGNAGGDSRSPRVRRRFLRVAEWLIPGIILAILPKCPLCIVAYVAIGTGIGLSVSTAANARILIITLCVGFLAFFAAKHLYRLVAATVTTDRHNFVR